MYKIKLAQPGHFLDVAALDRIAWPVEPDTYIPDGEHAWRLWCEYATVLISVESQPDQRELVTGALLMFPTNTSEIFLHKMKDDNETFSSMAVINPDFNKRQGIGMEIKFSKKTLPYLMQFKKMTKGEYFCSFEPASSFENRELQRANNNLRFLEPFKKVKNTVEFSILASNSEIKKYLKGNNS